MIGVRVAAALLLCLLDASPRGPAAPEARYGQLVDAALADTGAIWPVPKALVFGVMRQESAFDPRAVSKAGARGLMQLMPYNAAKVGLAPEDLFDPGRNIVAGVRLLAVLLRYYQGDVISTLIAYNSHPRELGSPVPNNGETPDYCLRVLAYYQEYLARYPLPVAPARTQVETGSLDPAPAAPLAIHWVPAPPAGARSVVHAPSKPVSQPR